MKFQTKELVIFAVLVVLCVASGIINPNVYQPGNLQNTGRLIGIYGIFSLGMAVVIITGGIDLSVGSVFAFLGVILSMALTEWHRSPTFALLLIVGGAGIIGAINGFLVTRANLQPFVATLCGLLFYRGMARFVSNDETKGFGDSKGFEWMKDLAVGNLGGVPTPLIILIVTSIVFYLLLHRSVFGRYLFAVGRNEEAARFAGVNTKQVILLAYIICGLSVGVSTVLFAFYTNSISPSSHGNFYELYAIAAAVLGGCSLRGGQGTVIGVLLGISLLQILRNLVNLLHIPSSLEFTVMGVVILAGVLLDSFFSSGKFAGRPKQGGEFRISQDTWIWIGTALGMVSGALVSFLFRPHNSSGGSPNLSEWFELATRDSASEQTLMICIIIGALPGFLVAKRFAREPL